MLDDLLGTDECIGMCVCGRLLRREVFNEHGELASVVLVDVDVLHDLVGEASECVAFVEAVPCLPESEDGVVYKVLDVILTLAVPSSHLPEPWELADEFTREVHRHWLVLSVSSRCGSFPSSAWLPASWCR